MERKTFKDKEKANAFVKKMKEKGRFVHSMWSEKDQTTTVLHGAGEPGPSEGTGIPPGQKGIAPPSIFEQPFVRGKKKKKLGRSPGAMGGKTKKVKKHGGKISYKMTGGQVVDAGYE